jgi:hypothetical protein
MVLAGCWFRHGDRITQPSTRLAFAGRWRSVTDGEARQHRLYGVAGILVTLLAGILLNVPLRILEFLPAMPVMTQSSPGWFGSPLKSAGN